MPQARPTLILLILASCLLAAPHARAAGIMINEYKNSNGSVGAGTKMVTDEYIEFVLTQNLTASQLSALTFGDSNDTTSALVGVFQFDLTTLNSVLASAGKSAFLAGTLIVVKGNGLGAQNLTYNPTLANIANDDAWSIELVAGQGAKDHPETLINGSIDIAGQGDVVWISTGNPPSSATDTSGFIDAIGHDNKPGLIANNVVSQFGSNHIVNATIGAPISIYNTADATVALTNANTGSMSSSNGGANTTWIQSGLRTAALAIPEPSRAGLIGLGLAAMCLWRRRP